ncbi:hypothetical protein TRAPUB_3701 [Trametes pubescens]|uniref:Fungal-type protein kinase domain-containing protein n=1 Tax=Trametes pubescens TaxID=154538 RepID=A0A1M2VD00_TRAPU|nr:hypothetical protein TRAPUB_3701 [Trametes pubescens]
MDSAHRVPITDFIPLFFPIAAEQAQDPTADVKATPYWPQPAPCAFDEEMKEVCWEQSESTMHRIFAESVNASQLVPNFMVATSRDEGANVSGLYPSANAPVTRGPRWDSLELSIHCFHIGGDPLGDGFYTPCSKENLEEVVNFAARVFARQHRTALYVVVLVGDLLRLARITRSTIVVTNPPVSYVNRPDLLADVFRRFAQLSRAQRGHDPTASLILPGDDMYAAMLAAAEDELDGAADYARRRFRDSLDPSWPWWRLEVHPSSQDKDKDESTARRFLVGRPHFYQEGMADKRGARGYVALAVDEPGQPFVYIKDTWRWEQNYIDQEGARLARLNAQGVRYVPTLVCHGDVPGQYVDIKVFLERVYGRQLDTPERPMPTLVSRHYRVVVREVGRSLRDFSNGRELVSLFRDCVEAHYDAYVLAHLLHRDISPGNMLMVPVDSEYGIQYRGMLMDWEMSESVEPGTNRTIARRGTYAYLSVKAMDHPRETYVVADELEAFLHVLVKMGIRYLPHDCADPAALHAAYYDTEEAGTHGECSHLKRLCIAEGVLQTPEGAAVTFLMPKKDRWGMITGSARRADPPSDHPLEDILIPLFQGAAERTHVLEEVRDREWRAAKAKERAERAALTGASKENGNKYTPPILKPRPPCLARPPLGNANANRPDEDDSDEAPDIEDIDKELYIMLETHRPILTLLSTALHRTDWPQSDKTRDQLSSDGDEYTDTSYDPEGSNSDGSISWRSTSSTEEDSADDVSGPHEDAEGSSKCSSEEDYTEEPSQTSGDGDAPQEETNSEVAPARRRPAKRARSDESDTSTSSDVALTKRLRGL